MDKHESRNLVVCLDGTGNHPKDATGTNVEIVFSLLDLSDPRKQVAYYDPGVGTFAASGAWTPLSRAASRASGLLFGVGLRQNLGEAYDWVIDHYQPGDRIFIFGFSRGAYTARALAGLLDKVGVLHPGADNLVPFAVSQYAFPAGRWSPNSARKQKFPWSQWRTQRLGRRTKSRFGALRHLSDVYAREVAPDAENEHIRSVPVAYLGLWDTVKAGGVLGWDLYWPGTSKLSRVVKGRHALSIDEKRRPYRVIHVADEAVKGGRIEEAWFAGVHSDVGGTFPKAKGDTFEKLSRIPLKWIVEGAVVQGLLVKDEVYSRRLSVVPANAKGTIHTMPAVWGLLTYSRRRIHAGDGVHSSVLDRVADPGMDYRPALPSDCRAIDPTWVGGPTTPRDSS